LEKGLHAHPQQTKKNQKIIRPGSSETLSGDRNRGRQKGAYAEVGKLDFAEGNEEDTGRTKQPSDEMTELADNSEQKGSGRFGEPRGMV